MECWVMWRDFYGSALLLLVLPVAFCLFLPLLETGLIIRQVLRYSIGWLHSMYFTLRFTCRSWNFYLLTTCDRVELPLNHYLQGEWALWCWGVHQASFQPIQIPMFPWRWLMSGNIPVERALSKLYWQCKYQPHRDIYRDWLKGGP